MPLTRLSRRAPRSTSSPRPPVSTTSPACGSVGGRGGARRRRRRRGRDHRRGRHGQGDGQRRATTRLSRASRSRLRARRARAGTPFFTGPGAHRERVQQHGRDGRDRGPDVRGRRAPSPSHVYAHAPQVGSCRARRAPMPPAGTGTPSATYAWMHQRGRVRVGGHERPAVAPAPVRPDRARSSKNAKWARRPSRCARSPPAPAPRRTWCSSRSRRSPSVPLWQCASSCAGSYGSSNAHPPSGHCACEEPRRRRGRRRRPGGVQRQHGQRVVEHRLVAVTGRPGRAWT